MKTSTLLSLVQACKFFSYFGVRTLLVLYMVEVLRYSDAKAFGINAVFCGLVELAGIFGGILADRMLGLKRALFLGSSLLVVGHFALLFDVSLFFPMGIIITGCSLFAGNITALFGMLFKETDPQRKRGFTVFYMMQNLGALLATFLCGFIAGEFGFQTAFAVASLGVFTGTAVLFFYKKMLADLETMPKEKIKPFTSLISLTGICGIGILCIFYATQAFLILPWISVGVLLLFSYKLLKNFKGAKEMLLQFFIYLGALILFFAVEDQICSSLMLFSERETIREFFGYQIPTSFIACLNPIVILLFGSLSLNKKGHMMTPFMITAAAFAVLAIFCLMGLSVSIFGVMGVVAIISFAELMVGPLVMSFASEIAAKGSPGMVMGMVPIAFSLAFQFSGCLSKMVATDNNPDPLYTYGIGFGKVALLMLGSSFALYLFKRKQARSGIPQQSVR